MGEKNTDFQKILFLGPKLNKINPAISGGGAVLFEDLVSQTENYDFKYEVIDTNGSNYTNNLTAYVLIIWKFLFKFPQYKYISIHGTAKDYIFIAPFVIFFSKLFHKKVSLRKFAGNFNEVFEQSGFFKKALIKYILKNADISFFETKYLVHYFTSFNKNTYWFPNVRNQTDIRTDTSFHKKFIFIGNIVKEKGINELIEVSKMLDDSYTIDIYGPMLEDFQDKIENSNMNYCGILDSKNVTETLALYDVLVLPSYREGYPGVIIEALSVGLPVIATNLAGIQEMLTDECSKLIEVQNVDQLKDSIEFFNKDNYEKFSKNALDRFEIFDSEIVTERFLEVINAKS